MPKYLIDINYDISGTVTVEVEAETEVEACRTAEEDAYEGEFDIMINKQLPGGADWRFEWVGVKKLKG